MKTSTDMQFDIDNCAVHISIQGDSADVPNVAKLIERLVSELQMGPRQRQLDDAQLKTLAGLLVDSADKNDTRYGVLGVAEASALHRLTCGVIEKPKTAQETPRLCACGQPVNPCKGATQCGDCCMKTIDEMEPEDDRPYRCDCGGPGPTHFKGGSGCKHEGFMG